MLNQLQIQYARSADLLQFAGQYTRLKHVASSGGGEWAGSCPIPGCRCHRDGFRVQPVQKRGKIISLLESCDFHRFSSIPVKAPDRKSDIEKAEKHIVLLEEALS